MCVSIPVNNHIQELIYKIVNDTPPVLDFLATNQGREG